MKTLFTNGTLQSFTPVFCIPFSTHWTLVIAFIGLLVTTNNVSFIVPLSVKYFLVYCRLEKFYTAISSVIGLLGKFVDWKCFGDGWCLMDAFRLNYFIRFWQVHSNNRWHKFRGSIRKFFMCGPQSGLSLLFRKWCFWWFHLRYPLGLCHGVPHCRTSTMTYSRTLFLILVEK